MCHHITRTRTKINIFFLEYAGELRIFVLRRKIVSNYINARSCETRRPQIPNTILQKRATGDYSKTERLLLAKETT